MSHPSTARTVPPHGRPQDCHALICSCRHTPVQVAELLNTPPPRRAQLAAQLAAQTARETRP